MVDTLLPGTVLGAALLWLPVDVGPIPRFILSTLLIFWPLLLVAVLLDGFLKKRRLWGIPYTAIALAVVAVLLGIDAFFAPKPTLITGAFQADLDSTERLTLALELSDAPATVTASGTPGVLYDFDIVDSGEVTVSLSGRRDKTLTLAKALATPYNRAARWQLELNGGVAGSLQVRTGSGAAQLDLRDLSLSELNLAAASGAVVATLATGTETTVTLEGGSGALTLTVPGGAAATISATLASGSTLFRLEEGASADLDITGSSGSIVFEVPTATTIAFRLEGSSGSLELPTNLSQVNRDGNTGLWQTKGDPGAAQLNIRLTQGSGNVSFK